MYKRYYLLMAIVFLAPLFSLGYGRASNDHSAEEERVRRVVEQGWRLRVEAGLKRNQGREAFFEEEMHKYFSDQPKNSSRFWQWGHPPFAIKSESPLAHLSPTASEWEIPKAYIANGRYNQKIAHFWVDECAVKKFNYRDILVRGDKAEVHVDIIFWCKISYIAQGQVRSTKPVGGERHTYILQKEKGAWKGI